MRSVATCVVWLALLSVGGCTPVQDATDASATDPDAPPGTLDESMDRLDAMLTPERAAELATGDPNRFHHSLGTAIRNSWRLWDETSPLSRWFGERGIFHPDDMSGIVLTSWQRRHNGEPIDLAGQIAHYRAYWAEQKREYEEGTDDSTTHADLVEHSDQGWAAMVLHHMPYQNEFAQSVRARASGDAKACFERMKPTTDPDSAEHTRLRIVVDGARRITSVTVVETEVEHFIDLDCFAAAMVGTVLPAPYADRTFDMGLVVFKRAEK